MEKRTTRFYRKNEAEVMESLGLKATKNSGAGWVEKEDGQNEYLIAQLKSTDANSIRVNLKDINTLEYNAGVCHKVPMFVIQFLGTNDVFIMARPTDIPEVAQYIITGNCQRPTDEFIINEGIKPKEDIIISTEGSRKSFWAEKEREDKKKYGKKS